MENKLITMIKNSKFDIFSVSQISFKSLYFDLRFKFRIQSQHNKNVFDLHPNPNIFFFSVLMVERKTNYRKNENLEKTIFLSYN